MKTIPGATDVVEPLKPLDVKDQLNSKLKPLAESKKLTLSNVAKPKPNPYSLNTLYKLFWYNYYKGNKDKLTLHTVRVLNYTEIPIYFFTLLDILKLKALFPFRIHYKQDHVEHLGVRNYPPLDLILNTAKTSEFNFIFAYMLPSYVLIKLGCKLGIYVYDTDEDDKKVTWWRLFKEVAMISVLADLGFYWLHRFVHQPGYYLEYHKKHHDFKYTIAMAHHWMTFKEASLFYLPQVLPPLILWGVTGQKMHVTSLWAGMWFTQINGILGHAGYRMPFIPKWLPFFQPSYHDYHHVDYSCNFGAIFPFIDRMFGTYINAGLEPDMAKVMQNVKIPKN